MEAAPHATKAGEKADWQGLISMISERGFRLKDQRMPEPPANLRSIGVRNSRGDDAFLSDSETCANPRVQFPPG